MYDSPTNLRIVTFGSAVILIRKRLVLGRWRCDWCDVDGCKPRFANISPKVYVCFWGGVL